MKFNPLGAWKDLHDTPWPIQLGHIESYKLAGELLDRLDLVEDWGCGTGYARRLFKHARYVGIDGSECRWADEIADLSCRKSTPDGILIRHVLEHNDNWKDILKNAIRCAQKRLVLVVFTELKAQTDLTPHYIEGIPYYSFAAKDIEQEFSPHAFQRLSAKTDTIWVMDK